MDKKYLMLLNKFMGNNEIYELLDLCVIDDKRNQEISYLKNGKYKDQRDLLSKLKVDLLSARMASEKK